MCSLMPRINEQDGGSRGASEGQSVLLDSAGLGLDVGSLVSKCMQDIPSDDTLKVSSSSQHVWVQPAHALAAVEACTASFRLCSNGEQVRPQEGL